MERLLTIAWTIAIARFIGSIRENEMQVRTNRDQGVFKLLVGQLI